MTEKTGKKSLHKFGKYLGYHREAEKKGGGKSEIKLRERGFVSRFRRKEARGFFLYQSMHETKIWSGIKDEGPDSGFIHSLSSCALLLDSPKNITEKANSFFPAPFGKATASPKCLCFYPQWRRSNKEMNRSARAYISPGLVSQKKQFISKHHRQTTFPDCSNFSKA